MWISLSKNTEYFVRKRLTDHIDSVEIQLDFFKFLHTIENTFGLRSGNQIFTFIQRKFDRHNGFIEYKILFFIAREVIKN